MSNTLQPAQLLLKWVQRQAAPNAFDWLSERLALIGIGQTSGLFMGFGLAARKMGKADLELTEADLQAAELARPGWNPAGWTLDQAARALLVLTAPSPEPAAYVAIIDKLFVAAEMGELIALYQALPLLPYPEQHRFRAAEGIRNNMQGVFCAVAHRNPYPAEQLDEGMWNQLVVKCLFVGVPLHPVVGLDRRANPALSHILIDLVHERRAAGRAVSPELWRVVAQAPVSGAVEEMAQTTARGTAAEQAAVALALASCPDEAASRALQSRPDLVEQVTRGDFSWEKISHGLA